MDGAPGTGTVLGFYKVESDYPHAPIPARTTVHWGADCDEGDKVTGGGFRSARPSFLPGIPPGDLIVRTNRPLILGGPEGWQVVMANYDTIFSSGFTVYAICADMTP
jgi:hypothetical protein